MANGWKVQIIPAFLAVVVTAMFSAEAADKKSNPLEAKIKRLIQELDGDEFEVRENATGELIKIGKPAVELLTAAEKSKSAEIRFRAKKILDEVLFEERQFSLFIVNRDGEETGKITFKDAPYLGSPAWSPSGKRLAMDVWYTPETQFQNTHIFVCDPDGKKVKDLGTGAMPSWSPDEKQIVFHDYSPRSGIWRMNADGSNRKRIHSTGNSPRWSPDGKTIAFLSNGISLYDTKTKTVKVFENPSTKSANIGLAWSPDSNRICFTRRTSPVELVIVDVDDPGKEAVVRYQGRLVTHVGWSPDGKQLSFALTKAEKGKTSMQSYLAGVNSEDPPRLLKGQRTDRKNRNVIFSPDGKRMAYVSVPYRVRGR